MLSLSEARSKILSLATPAEAIEVALPEAVGLVAAEPLVADVDLPPFDRAGAEGYAVRAADLVKEARLRVVGLHHSGGDTEVGPGQAAPVAVGDPMPVGADTVVPTARAQPRPTVGPPREILVRDGTERGANVIARGFYLHAGAKLAPAGTRIRTAMIGMLASQGCVHPVCFRRVRVAVLAVGDHLVGPGEAPVMHRERNAAGPAVVGPCIQWGATAHDLGTVAVRELDSALSRALTAPVVVVLGPADGPVPRALRRARVESIFTGVPLSPGKQISYGIVRDASGRACSHIFHLEPNPIAALTAVTLLVGPLVARLQGGVVDDAPLRARWDGTHPQTDDRVWAVAVTLMTDVQGQLTARPVPYRGENDLLGFARAQALGLLPPQSGPWHGGEVVDVVPLGPWVL